MRSNDTENLAKELLKLPLVRSVDDTVIENGFIEYLTLDHEKLGRIDVRRLKAEDAESLFGFYFDNLSERDRSLFPPYPLFSPPVNSAGELGERISEWQEEGDWTVFKLVRDNVLIGVSLLKRWSTGRPTSGLAVHQDFRNNGLGVLLQTLVVQQARVMGLKRVCATVAPDNAASLKLHGHCGFRETGRKVPHQAYKDGKEIVDREDVELILELDG